MVLRGRIRWDNFFLHVVNDEVVVECRLARSVPQRRHSVDFSTCCSVCNVSINYGTHHRIKSRSIDHRITRSTAMFIHLMVIFRFNTYAPINVNL